MLVLIGSLCAGATAEPDGAEAWGHPARLRAIGTGLLQREAVLGGVALGAAAAVLSLRDDEIVAWTHDREAFGPDAPDIGYWLGHRYTVAGSVLALGGSGLLLHRPYIVESAAQLLQAQLLSAGVTQALKYATQRERPDGSNQLSFPSGHATAAWTTAALLHGRFGWRVGLPAHAAALYVGGSRIQGRKHHASDVFMGFAVAQWVTRAVLGAAEPELARPSHLLWLPPTPQRFDGLALLRAQF